MTRENKLALVVGFGLILFVGILISDHFSTARSQQAANFTSPGVVDPLATAQARNSNLVELTTLTPPTPAVNTTNRPVSTSESPRPEQTNSVFDGALTDATVQPREDVRPITPGNPLNSELFRPVPPESEPILVKHIMHEVKGGETFFKICRQYYGDSSLAGSLAKYNKIDDPAALRAGRQLQIPPAELIGGKPTIVKKPVPPASPNTPSLRVLGETRTVVQNTSSSAKPTQASSKGKTYTVKSGDSLATIAHRHFGSKAKWKKIYDMNRDVIDDPDNVKIGTVLKLL